MLKLSFFIPHSSYDDKEAGKERNLGGTELIHYTS